MQRCEQRIRFNKELLHTRKGSEGTNFLYSKSIPFVHETNSIVVNSSLQQQKKVDAANLPAHHTRASGHARLQGLPVPTVDIE